MNNLIDQNNKELRERNFNEFKTKLKANNINAKVLPINALSIDVDSHVKALGIKYKEGMSTLILSTDNTLIALLRRDDRKINNKKLREVLKTKSFQFGDISLLGEMYFEQGLISPLLLEERFKRAIQGHEYTDYSYRILVDKSVLEMNKVICGTTSHDFVLEIQKDELLKNIGSYEVVDVTIPSDERIDFEDSKPRILTGDRPTGPLHLGHYVGSIKNRVLLQDKYDLFYLIADVQGLTDNYDNPEKVRNNVFQIAQDNLACGLDPEKSTILIQSMIPQTAELTVLFMNLVSLNEVLRNPTVKTEIKEKGFEETTPFGFVAYPVSQAADILGVRASLVPVGKDQAPMIELSREVAKRFNHLYKTELFNIPEALFGVTQNLVGTDGDSKMSKSKGNTINLNDDEEAVNEKVKKMYTDPTRIHATDPGHVEGNPAFIYHDIFNENKDEVEDLKERYLKGTVGDIEVKEKLAKAINNFLEPIRARREEFPMEKVREIVMEGTKKAQAESEITMQMVREAMKINY